MENQASTISESFNFIANSVSIQQSQQALKCYSDGLESALNLGDETPIFLDTNVLLDYYRISFSERQQLQKFLEVNTNRIYLTKQIESEFLKHRIDHIKSYLKSLEEFVNAYRNIKSEIEKLKGGEIKGFDHYLNSNPILKNDYQDLRNELVKFNETLKEKLKSLFQDTDFEQQINEKERKIEEIKKRLEGEADIERNDPLLDLIANFKVIGNLSEEEKDFVLAKYDELNSKYSNVKGDQNHNWKYTFPGCGEGKDKDEPQGDFIIYHEMIKFMKSHDSNIIFLTNDVEKNDWLFRNKAELLPYTHYIVNTFIATNKTMYVFQAKDKIRVSYQPIYKEEKLDSSHAEHESTIVGKIVLPGPKIIGKIELPNFEDDDFEDWEFSDFDFSDITEDEFIRELYQSQNWARVYGDNFVGIRSFIMKYLGGKGFHFRTSFGIKNKLKNEGFIEEYIYKPRKEFYNDVEALKLTSKGVERARALLPGFISQE